MVRPVQGVVSFVWRLTLVKLVASCFMAIIVTTSAVSAAADSNCTCTSCLCGNVDLAAIALITKAVSPEYVSFTGSFDSFSPPPPPLCYVDCHDIALGPDVPALPIELAVLNLKDTGLKPGALAALEQYVHTRVLGLTDNTLWREEDGGGPPANAFAAFPALVVLLLSKTSMKQLPRDALAGLPQLTVLQLASNLLTTAPTEALRAVGTSLLQLDLSNNLIRVLSLTDLFTTLPALKSLTLKLEDSLEVLQYDQEALTRSSLYHLQQFELRLPLPLTTTQPQYEGFIAVTSRLLPSLQDAEQLTYVGPGVKYILTSLPRENKVAFLKLFAYGPQSWDKTITAIDPIVLPSTVNWAAQAGVLPRSLAVAKVQPLLEFAIQEQMKCRTAFSGRRHAAHSLAERMVTDGLPMARCDCNIPGYTQITNVSHCGPRELIPCSTQPNAYYFPWQMADGRADCVNAEDEVYPAMQWRLQGSLVGHQSNPSYASKATCSFFDQFEEDDLCNLDCLALLNVTAEKGIMRTVSVLEDGSPAGCASGSLCPEGVLVLEGPFALSGTIGLTTLR